MLDAGPGANGAGGEAFVVHGWNIKEDQREYALTELREMFRRGIAGRGLLYDAEGSLAAMGCESGSSAGRGGGILRVVTVTQARVRLFGSTL
jgi:hypothetical protein